MLLSPTLRFRLALGAAFASLVAGGCLYSPVVKNDATLAYPTPDANGNVTVRWKPVALPSAGVTFSVENQPSPAPSGLTQLDDSTGPVYSATFPTGNLPPALYTVDILTDPSATTPTARVNFVVPGAAAPSASPS